MIRALFLLIFNLVNLCRRVMRKLVKAVKARFRPAKRRFVKLEVPSGIQLAGETRKIGPIAIGHADKGPYWDFEALLGKLAKDPEVEGVYFRVEPQGGSLAEVSAMADRLQVLRDAGKRVLCHFDQAMFKEYVLASAADTVMMTPAGRLYTFGMRMEMTFLGDAFDKVGIDAQFIHLGQFKTAMHRFTRRRMSRSQRRGSRQLLEGLSSSALTRIASAREITIEQAAAMLDRAPIPAREARRMSLVDRMVYVDGVRNAIEQEDDCERTVELLSSANYLRQSESKLKWRPLMRRKKKIAVLSLSGMIMMGNEGLPMQFRNAITPPPVVEALDRLRKDASVVAVVIHIDSPGGSALASDLIWRRLRKLGEHKPTIAFLGSVAASGGYYIAAGAQQIVSLPETLTGSIGVIAGKLSGGALLDKLGVHAEALSIGETAGFTSLTTSLSEREFDNLQRDIRSFYRRFLHRVAASRKMDKRTLHRLARGRVYTGRRAHTIGLVDHLGDLEFAIDLACKEAGVERDKAAVTFVDHRKGGLRSLFGRKRSAAAVEVETEGFDTRARAASVAEESLSSLVPEGLESYVAAAALMRTQGALALWPFIQAPV